MKRFIHRTSWKFRVISVLAIFLLSSCYSCSIKNRNSDQQNKERESQVEVIEEPIDDSQAIDSNVRSATPVEGAQLKKEAIDRHSQPEDFGADDIERDDDYPQESDWNESEDEEPEEPEEDGYEEDEAEYESTDQE